MRQVVLDTETTGLDPKQGHRIIEIGCVELLDRKLTGRHYQCYINPEREVDAGAMEVHGISNQFLADKPKFTQIAADFLNFVNGAELIIHNAPFDIGFIDYELSLLVDSSIRNIEQTCSVLDSLVLARAKHPGQRNSLDALCKRYDVDNTQRDLHGALLDSEILADVYLAMTSGQSSFQLREEDGNEGGTQNEIRRVSSNRPALKVVRPTPEEQNAHDIRLNEIDEESKGNCLWLHQLTERKSH